MSNNEQFFTLLRTYLRIEPIGGGGGGGGQRPVMSSNVQ